MRTADSGFDHNTMAEAFAGPGQDTRQWVSFGTVDPGSPDNGGTPVEFDAQGPLVSVTLQPSNLPVVCRVAGRFSGNLEGSYTPFIEGDEVLVLVPQGDERAGCTIVGRLNNEIDAFPTTVGGVDVTQNTTAFDRTRTPYVFEAASSWMVRSALTGAFISITPDGKIVISNADKAFMAFNPDFIGLQDATGALLLQIDLHDKNVVVQAGSSRLLVDPKAGSWLSSGSIALGGYGATPFDHATTAEGMVNFVAQVFTALSAALVGVGAAPLTGTSLAALINPAALTVLINAALVASTGTSTAPYAAALSAALFGKLGVPNFPGVGSPSVQVG